MVKNDHERIEEGLVMIDEGISRIKNLSLNMLKYAREWKPTIQFTNLAPIVKDVCKAITRTASGQSTTIRCHVPDHLPPAACDASLVHMALMDIVTNALDACSMKVYEDAGIPEIVLDVYPEKTSKFVVLEVRDNGIGMTEETKAKIFAPFFSTKEQAGTGLGLSLASRIINLHGGEIHVESEPGKGSAFRITLPVAHVNTKRGA
jgi:signal transduction histidine kinase